MNCDVCLTESFEIALHIGYIIMFSTESFKITLHIGYMIVVFHHGSAFPSISGRLSPFWPSSSIGMLD